MSGTRSGRCFETILTEANIKLYSGVCTISRNVPTYLCINIIHLYYE